MESRRSFWFMILSFCVFLTVIWCYFAFIPGILLIFPFCLPILIPISSMANAARDSEKPGYKTVKTLEKYSSRISFGVALCYVVGFFYLAASGFYREYAGYCDFLCLLATVVVATTIFVHVVVNVALYVVSRRRSYGYTIVAHVFLILSACLSRLFFGQMLQAL